MSETPTDHEVYNPHALQERWLPVWDRLDLNRAGVRAGAAKKYVCDMFSYPSGDLHMGHAEAFGIGDVLARYWMRRGFDVLHPVGWDSFGLNAENAAIKRGEHPATWTYANIDTQADSFRRYAVSFDWSTRLHTSDPEYYRWTQWLFLRFRERGLAYRKQAPVNWCPQDQTVLANEQVVGVLGDAEEPLLELADLDERAAALAAPVDDLLVGQHGLVVRAPLHRRLLAVGQAVLEELQEDPLRPAVIRRLVGGELARPVDRDAPPAQLLLEGGDRLLGGLARWLPRPDRVVLRR